MASMVDARLLEQVTALTTGEQVELIGAVWDSLDRSRIQVSAADRQMLDEALADLEAHPDGGLSAAESVGRLFARVA